MSLRIDFVSGADVELQEAFSRFEDYRDGFGVEFLTVVEAYLARIVAFPKIAPLYLDSVRRQVMRRFPYSIFYQEQPARIMVTAILDLRRDESETIRRLRR